MSSTNRGFVFGSGASNDFSFATPEGQIAMPEAASRPATLPDNDSRNPHTPGDAYVTLAQYELVEKRYEDVLKRLEILEAEAKGHEATKKMLKTGSNNLEKAYQSLQNTNQSAEDKIKELQEINRKLNKQVDISKAALTASQDQHKATSRHLDAALKREEEAITTLSTTSPVSAASVLGYAPITSAEIVPVTAEPPAQPVLTLAPTMSVSVTPVSASSASAPPLVLAPIMSVDLPPAFEPPGHQDDKWWLYVLLLLLCVWFAGRFGGGMMGSGEPFGFGGLLGAGDGVVSRAHARIFGMLVEFTGGLDTFV